MPKDKDTLTAEQVAELVKASEDLQVFHEIDQKRELREESGGIVRQHAKISKEVKENKENGLS